MRFAVLLLLSSFAVASAADDYPLGPDSVRRRPGVPQGTVTQHQWTSSKIFPGTVRDYWVYVPAQYNARKPACVLIVQDGGGMVKEDGAWRYPIVLDNLISEGAMPVTIGIFINPGVLPARSSDTQQDRFNRSYEYDGLSDKYARFLIDEVLPEVGKTYALSSDPNDRALAGSSSGAAAAFTAAWHRPDAFRRVLSTIGSYTNLRGADSYINLIRKMEPKPIRVFLEDGNSDLNLYSGSWWMANQSMYLALLYAGYDVTFSTSNEGHNSKHGAAILPDALRWLWRDWPKPITASHGAPGSERHYVTEILDPQSDWEVVSEGYKFTEGPAVDKDGRLYFVDVPANRIYRMDDSGKAVVFAENTGGASGLMFGPDGRLYAAQSNARNVVAYAADAAETVLAEDIAGNDLAVSSKGRIYVTEPSKGRIWVIDASGAKRVAHEGGINFANGVRFSPDESLLLVADSQGRFVWSFQVQPDGTLANGEPFYHLELPDETNSGRIASGADGMALDTEGYLYVATNLGIQVCDQPGRVVAVIRKPSAASPSNLVFGGPGRNTLYVTTPDKVYRRRLRREGFLPWQPVKPPKPRL